MDPYPHLIHPERLPTPQEYDTIIAAKQSYDAQRTDLRQEIEQLVARLAKVQKELHLLEENIDAHARLISPLRRIPSEQRFGTTSFPSQPHAVQTCESFPTRCYTPLRAPCWCASTGMTSASNTAHSGQKS
ncbi:hypothetical protein BDV98DRAFT_269385 [Pterulicium gracile]|uniref:Uncharacterized protein n=1 Tax=Pterulicium gracile TaxID=1884261 RepID=A0A5C3QA69_9AGAR|nr:hypothetical protein BDV98DRAFT_269385 [Pterula gracilis]